MLPKVKTIKIVRDEKAPETMELIAAEIIAVSNAFEKLQKGPLNGRAIHLLLKGMLPSVAMQDIKAVLDAAADLKKYYLKKGA